MKKIIAMLCAIAFLSTGCEIYDCEAAEAEITTLSSKFVANVTMENCTNYIDKIDEYDSEGCGTSEDADFNCEEYVCAIQESYMLIYSLSMVFADSATYCAYYDSTGLAAQELVNAGGCGDYSTLTPGVDWTQTMVDTWVNDGCDYGDSTTVNSSRPPFKNFNKEEAIEIVKDIAFSLPENYADAIIRKLNKKIPN